MSSIKESLEFFCTMHVKLFLLVPSQYIHEYFEMMYLEQFRVCIDNFKYILFQYRLKKLDAFL